MCFAPAHWFQEYLGMRRMHKQAERMFTHHGVLGEGLDLLDGAGSALLEGDTVNLY